jgi:phage FluMu protein Com
MNDIRCFNCKKLLFKGNFKGIIEIKCDKCKKIITIYKTEEEEKQVINEEKQKPTKADKFIVYCEKWQKLNN